MADRLAAPSCGGRLGRLHVPGCGVGTERERSLRCALFEEGDVEAATHGCSGFKTWNGAWHLSGPVYVLQWTTGVFDLASAERLTAEEIFGGSASLPAEFFGDALAVGDFNDDRLDDLAIGVPNEAVEGVREGAVIVLLGEEGFGIPHFRQVPPLTR